MAVEPQDRANAFEGAGGAVALAVALGTALFVLYSAQFGLFESMVQRGIVIAAILFLAYLKVIRGPGRSSPNRLFHLALALVGVAIILYFAFNRDAIALRPTGPTQIEILLGLVLVGLIIDITRREVGWALPLIALTFIAYALLGRYMPAVLAHRGVPPAYLIQYLSMEVEGLWGTPVAVAATYIAMFLILGAVLHASGAGQFMVDISYAALGRVRGGPAKMAVVASALFGTVSGSTVANVVGTGTFTIPLMKSSGYRPRFAAAVEAVASCGGQLMPPVMGASAFIMAEVLGVPYAQIATAALLPALLYYLSLFLSVDLEAARLGLKGLPQSEFPPVLPLLVKRGYVLLPLFVLILLLVVLGWSPMKAAFWAVALAIVLAFLNPEIRRRPFLLVKGLASSIETLVPVAAACACSGLVIASLVITGLTVEMSALLVEVGGESLFLLLVLTMLASLVLGIGLPTVAAYILLAILVAPGLVRLGVDPIAAHLFVFYFGIVSTITPPVAMAAFAAAAIAGTDYMRTGLLAMRIGLSAFILPYMFVIGPGLLLQGSAREIIVATLTASLGIWALTAAVIGYIGAPLQMWKRGLLGIAALALIFQGLLTDILGIAIIAAVVTPQVFAWHRRRRGAAAPVQPNEAMVPQNIED